ncbi:hypothetical protein pb186bvf_012957 [Paramecium bursaria]
MINRVYPQNLQHIPEENSRLSPERDSVRASNQSINEQYKSKLLKIYFIFSIYLLAEIIYILASQVYGGKCDEVITRFVIIILILSVLNFSLFVYFQFSLSLIKEIHQRFENIQEFQEILLHKNIWLKALLFTLKTVEFICIISFITLSDQIQSCHLAESIMIWYWISVRIIKVVLLTVRLIIKLQQLSYEVYLAANPHVRWLNKLNSLKKEKVTGKVYDENKCIICLQDFTDGQTFIRLNCHNNHVFHEQCLIQWFDSNKSCPICRINV